MRMENKSCKVAVMECAAYDACLLTKKLDEGAALLGGWDRWVRPGSTVLLKLNLIRPMPPESAAVTHCELVRALVRILKGRGCNVWVGDSSGGAIAGRAQTGRTLQVSGIEKMAEEEGAIVKNFDREGVVEVKTAGGGAMHLARPMFDADFVINVPKLKTHTAAVVTLAMKNLFGCVPGLGKALYHRASPTAEALGEVLCDIHSAVRVGLHIVDGVTAMDRLGPVTGQRFPAKKLLLGTDALAVDAVAAKMMGLGLQELPIYRTALRRGLGQWRLDAIDVCGDYDAPPSLKDFRLPPRMLSRGGSGALQRIVGLMKTRPQIDLKACKDCGICVDSCPMQVIDRETKRIDYSKCIGCMCCHEMCILGAVRLVKANPLMRALSVFRRS